MRSKVSALIRNSLFICTFMLATVAQAEVVEGIVAVVDDNIIMVTDLEQRIRELSLDPEDKTVARQVLRLMVEDMIVQKTYSSMGYPAPDPGYVAAFSEQTQLSMRDSEVMVMRRTLMDAMVSSRVVVTDKMIADYYSKDPRYAGKESVHLKQIAVKDDKVKSEQVIKRLKAGDDFDQIASDLSDVLFEGKNDIGWIAVDNLKSETRAAVAKAEAGEVVGPLSVSGYDFFFKVVERGTHGGANFDKVRYDIENELGEHYRKEAFEHWLNKIMSGHYIGVYLD